MFQGAESISLIAPQILLEMGTRSGDYPIQKIELSSYLVDFLRAVGENLGTEEETSFPMLLLDFRRTAIEKLFAIHSRVEQDIERLAVVQASRISVSSLVMALRLQRRSQNS